MEKDKIYTRRFTPGQILTACICQKYGKNYKEVKTLLGISSSQLKMLMNDLKQITKEQGLLLAERYKLLKNTFEYGQC